MRAKRELTAAGTAIALTGVLSCVPAATAKPVRAQPAEEVPGEMGEVKRALLPLLCQIHRFVSTDDVVRYMQQRRRQGGAA